MKKPQNHLLGDMHALSPEDHLCSLHLHREGCVESFFTIPRRNGEDPTSMFRRLDDALHVGEGRNARIARMDSIGLLNTMGTADLQQKYCCDCANCPLNFVDDEGNRGCPVTALYVNAVAETPVEAVWLGGRMVGTVFEDAHARYCQLNDIQADPFLPRDEQARQVFERMESALHQTGMDFSHVIRTWLFLDDILDWYDQFNDVRDKFFTERCVYDGMVPASTGVGAGNTSNAAVVAHLTAVMPLDRSVRIQAVASPLQGPAMEYGSSFSRAVEVATPDHRRLLISGTASIAESGETLHVGDVDAQVACTMEVVGAIIESRNMDWSDATRAAAYFKHFNDIPALDAWCLQHNLTGLPVAVVQNDVCRDDLLFEIEVDCVKAESN